MQQLGERFEIRPSELSKFLGIDTTENEPRKRVSRGPVPRYASQLEQIAGMGFTDRERVLEILARVNGAFPILGTSSLVERF